MNHKSLDATPAPPIRTVIIPHSLSHQINLSPCKIYGSLQITYTPSLELWKGAICLLEDLGMVVDKSAKDPHFTTGHFLSAKEKQEPRISIERNIDERCLTRKLDLYFVPYGRSYAGFG